MRISKVANRLHGWDSVLKVLLCVVLVVSLCPPFVGAMADEPDPVEPQAVDTALDASALEDDSSMEVFADEADADEPAASGNAADEGAGAVGEADDDSPAADAGVASDPAVPDAEADEPAPGDSDNSDNNDTPPAAASDNTTPQSGAAATEDAAKETLTYEDKTLVATVTAPAGVLPVGATLEVEEIHPVDYASAEAYAEALTSLSQELRKDDKSYSEAKVYDIRILDAAGAEVEPNGKVQVELSYKKKLDLDGAQKDAKNVDVAHVDDEGALEILDADIDTTKAGAVKSAGFTTDSFSYYIVFSNSSSTGSTTEPVQVGNYGWLKFVTSGTQNTDWGHYASESELPALGTNDAYHRILQVNLWKLKSGGTEGSYDSANYEHIAKNQYFWTWENQVTIDDFDLVNLEVVHTRMHTAWDAANDRENNSLIDTYNVRGYQSSDNTGSDLNVLDVYVKDDTPPVDSSTKYIVRYVHADGSVSDGNVRYLTDGQSANISAASQKREGEVYSGMSIVTGVDAMSNQNDSNGSVTISYNSDVDIAKVYIYYKDDPSGAETYTGSRERYDKNGQEQYYTGEKGLNTNKKASAVTGNDRQFLLDLEAWYVKDPASVGMVLDASGSMAWTAGTPKAIELTAAEAASITSSYASKTSSSNKLSLSEVNNILTTKYTENSTLGYNGYHYYVKDSRANVNEYVPIGYKQNKDNTTVNTGKYGQLNGGQYVVWTDQQGEGWYYVNSTSNKTYINNSNNSFKIGKSYDSSHNDSLKFYFKKVGDTYQLWCEYYEGGASRQGQIFEKRDKMFTKMETLQDSLSQFGSILLGSSPDSQIAMTRFSSERLDVSRLPLLNWTSSTVEVAAAMDQGQGHTLGTSKNDDGVTVYEYGLTGSTDTYKGVEAYIKYFTKGEKNNYDPTNTNGQRAKYLVIFTDGKDTHGDSTASEWGSTGGYVSKMKAAGYTVITVLMKSLAMETNNEYTDAHNFLNGLADSDEYGNKLYFEASSDSAHDMVERFREIAGYIAAGLQDYSVRDYIDPRFDVVNDAGDILTKLDSNGKFTEGVDEATHLRSFTTPDGKQAQLGYDPGKKMFFVLWQKQTIPGTTIDSDKVNVWSSQVRVQAKEDFLGGNDILSNGNESGMNSVYKPTGTIMEVDGKKVFTPTTDQYGRETVNTSDSTKYPNKDFPYTSVNPGLLDVVLGNYEDTIFLGENITPGELFSSKTSDVFTRETEPRDSHRVADTAYNTLVTSGLGDTDGSSAWFVEYLERAGVKLHNNKDFYAKVFQHIDLTNLNTLLTALDTNGDYTVAKSGSTVTFTGKEGTNAAGEVIFIDKASDNAKVEITLPYYYLEEPGNAASYAGDANKHGKDKVGTIKYTWTMVNFAENTASKDGHDDANKFVEFDTYIDKATHMDVDQSVQYQLKISYTPDLAPTAADGNNDGSDRTKALTGQTTVNQPLIRDAVGNGTETGGQWKAAVPTTDEMGWAVIHAVNGRILVEKKMLKTDWEDAKEKLTNPKMTFSLEGKKITSEGKDEEVWSKELPLPTTAVREEGNYVYLLSEWVTGLPIGEYTLSESPEGGLKLKQIAGIDNVIFYPDNDNPQDAAEPYNMTSTNWATNHDGPGATVTWKIGSEPKVTDPNYEPTTFTYAKVKEDLSTKTAKNYDPTQDKAYLNAQIGRAEVLNELQKTSIEVVKAWRPSAPSSPIVVKLSGTDGSARYAELNSTNGWKYTFEQLPIDDTEYTVVEGTGTVSDDGTTCTEWRAFEDKFSFANKKYQRVSTVYKDKNGEVLDGCITGNVPDKAGTATITNQELTKVAVAKVWENLAPSADAKFAIQLNSTGEDARYAQLTADNNWTYTFEDLPVAANRKYSIVEGEGTVADDGACADFKAFTPDSDGFFTFDGKKYKQESLEYTPAGGTASATPLACMSPDSGTATVTNAAYTKVEVQKIWSEIDPGNETVVVRLKGSDNSELFAVLGGSNPLAYTFDNLKVKDGLTYTVEEGTATVAADGTVTNFTPFPAVFKVNGQDAVQQSLVYYTDANAQTKAASNNMSGSVSPYGGKAVITNGPAGADVKLKKTDATDDSAITGAKFTLKKGDAFATATEVALDSDATDGDGVIDLGKLVPGTYWLVETDVPAGYLMRPADKPIKVTVVNTTVTIEDEYTPAATLGGPDATGLYTITVPNLRTYSLPAAAGPGIFEFLFLGAFIMTLVAGLALYKRREPAGSRTARRAAPGRR